LSYWIALFLAIAGNIAANMSFKHFVTTTNLDASWASVRITVTHPSFWLGIAFGVSLLACYLYAMKGLPLSIAYTTATSLSIVGITCVGVFLYGETLGIRAMIGIPVILAGVVLMSTS
jgi:multidrug transporter EmrE-like cation transporter